MQLLICTSNCLPVYLDALQALYQARQARLCCGNKRLQSLSGLLRFISCPHYTFIVALLRLGPRCPPFGTQADREEASVWNFTSHCSRGEKRYMTSHMLAVKASAQKQHISHHILLAKGSYMATSELIGQGCIILPQGGAWEYLAPVIQSTTGISSKAHLNLLLIVLSASKSYSSPKFTILLLGITIYQSAK